MSSEPFKKYVIRFDYGNTSTGSGVIFKPSKQSSTVYLITAKHNFFEKYYSIKEHTGTSIDVSNVSIHILLESVSIENIEIKLKNNKFYFLKNSSCDVAFAILNIDQSPEIDINSIHALEIFDCNNANLEKINYFSLGYPSGSATKIFLSNMSSFHLEYSNEEDQYFNTRFLSRNPSNFTLSRVDDYMAGLSGAGVFVRQKEGISCLSHIQFSVKEPNQLNAIRLDIFLDEINQVIESNSPDADLLSSQTYVLLDNEKLDFTEYGDLEFFKEKIKYELPAYRTELEKLFPYSKDLINKKVNEFIDGAINKKLEALDQEFIRSLIPCLRNKHNEIINQTKGLSYIYAYLAVASANYAAQTRTSLFKRAIALNPEHQQTFLLQKQKIMGNADARKKIVEESLIDTLTLYNQLIVDEKNELIKLKTIEEGMQKIYEFNGKNDKELREENLLHYFKQLESTLKQSSLIREFYKYSYLGDSYSKFFDNKEDALYFYQVAIRILEKSSTNENDSKTLEKLKEKSLHITKEFAAALSEDQHQKAIAEANEILAKQEDKELKASLFQKLSK